MTLTVYDIANMIDLSCVRTNSKKSDIDDLVENAIRYRFGQVSIMQSFIPEVKKMLQGHPGIHLVGNVSFPSGSDATAVKVFQAGEMVAAGCDEIDMVLNVGKLLSGEFAEVEQDVAAVVKAAGGLPVKVIIEISYLNQREVEFACETAIKAGAAFVKTGTGWADKGTTVEDVKLVKSIVGDRIKIKASGGIRSLATLLEMYKHGACRFGVNLKSGKSIIAEALSHPEMLSF
ncbi:MAG: deoxyribose-phosphate aldolase [Anaerolineaceae bacterium]